MKTGWIAFIMCGVIFLGLNSMAADTAYPTRPIELTIGYAPGAGSDLGARLLVEHTKQYLGQDIVCINKPGGAGRVGLTFLSKEKPDGYSLASTTDSSLVMLPHIEKVPYKVFEDFTFICQFGTLDLGTVVAQNSPFKTFKEVIEFARGNPDKLTIGIVGVGSSDHIGYQILAMHENLKFKFVPFAGGAPALTALLGGHVMITTASASTWASHVKSNTVRLLAVMGEERMEQFPNAPTLKESGYPYLVFQSWYVVCGPKNMEPSVVKRLEDAFRKAILTPEFIKMAKELIIYTKKPLFGLELREGLIQRDKTNVERFKNWE